jgi:hypothetical protein
MAAEFFLNFLARTSDFSFFNPNSENAQSRREEFSISRHPDSISGCPGVCTGPSFEIAGNAPGRHAMTLGSPWIRIASPAKVEAGSASDSPVDSLSPARG